MREENKPNTALTEWKPAQKVWEGPSLPPLGRKGKILRNLLLTAVFAACIWGLYGYPLGADAPKDPEDGRQLNSLREGGYGPFHSGYELGLEDLDPEAEWVRLDYGPGETIFSFVVELEEGRT